MWMGVRPLKARLSELRLVLLSKLMWARLSVLVLVQMPAVVLTQLSEHRRN
jgi:hypothetical protein